MSIEKNYAIAAIVLGGIESVIGVIVLIASFVLTGEANLKLFLTPYWAGLTILISGILGLVSGYKKNRNCMIAFMVLNVFCFIVEIVSVVMLGFFSIQNSILFNIQGDYTIYHYTNNLTFAQRESRKLLLKERDRLNNADKDQLFRTNKQGGGVAIFTKYDIIAYEVSVSPLYKEVEQIWCSIVLHKTKILVGCIYRPPNRTDLINNAINELIKTAKKAVMNGKYSNVIIV
nr:unnamed protein product [Hydra vulgaris]